MPDKAYWEITSDVRIRLKYFIILKVEKGEESEKTPITFSHIIIF